MENSRISWALEAERKPKLRTFINIHDFDKHQILIKAHLSRYQRSLVAQLKSGILPLKIETDRYQGIPEHLRICNLCNSGSVENEFHFLFHCPKLSEIRNPIISDYDTPLESFTSDSNKVHYMLQEENIRKTGILLEQLYRDRQRQIYK